MHVFQMVNSESLLIFGVDIGAVHLLYFQKPVTQLFNSSFQSEGGVIKIQMQVSVECVSDNCSQ